MLLRHFQSIFIAFVVGVALWGWRSDYIGRRPAMIAGLICYGTGSVMAIIATDFSVLLLTRIFSLMGAALAVSPVFGLMSRSWRVSLYGHTGCNTAAGTDCGPTAGNTSR